MEKEKKPKFEEIIKNGSSDAIAILIGCELLKDEGLEKLTFEQCLKAASCSLFKNWKKAKKIYNLLLEKAETTEDFIKIFEEENFIKKEEELWSLAKKAARSSWDFYILFIHTDIKNQEKGFFFKKIQGSLKNFEEVKEILKSDIWCQKRYFTDEEEFLLIEIVRKRFAETFDDFYFLINCHRSEEEKFYYFKKMKYLAKTYPEGKKLVEHSYLCSNKEERFELFKLVSNFAKKEEDFDRIRYYANNWRERRIVRKIQNKKKE